MTALAEVDKDIDNKRFLNISLIGNFASKISAYFDEVFYLGMDKDNERILITQPSDGVIAKDRSGKLNKSEKADLNLIKEKICHLRH